MGNPVQSILRFTAARPKIGDLVLNCTTREVHGGEFEIPQSPIEDGSSLSDHRIELNRVLEMEAIISPYPDNIVDEQASNVLIAYDAITSRSLNYYRSIWARVRALASSNETFEVITDREIYNSMTFKSYSHVEQNEGIIRLQAILWQIQFATVLSEKFLSPSFADIGGSSANVGEQGVSPI